MERAPWEDWPDEKWREVLQRATGRFFAELMLTYGFADDRAGLIAQLNKRRQEGMFDPATGLMSREWFTQVLERVVSEEVDSLAGELRESVTHLAGEGFSADEANRLIALWLRRHERGADDAPESC